MGSAAGVIHEVDYYRRMMLGVRRLIRYPRIADYAAVLREQMEQRETRFLEMARRIVFDRPDNPYAEMFRLAGCGYRDLAESVRRNGLEATLSSLRDSGVWLSHDEFKGKTPVVRAGKTIASKPGAFVNPLVRGYVESRSSGSRGIATRTRQSTELQVYRCAYDDLLTREFGLEERILMQVRPILPSFMGVHESIRETRAGRRMVKWFSVPGTLRDSGHYRAATSAVVFGVRRLGATVPYPTYLPDNDFLPVAEWVARRKQEGRLCVIHSFVSPSLRVAAAALEAGLDIAGTIFLSGGEALTDAKRRGIEAAGCRVYSRYVINEVGHIGTGCTEMVSGNCVHLYQDAVAVTSRVRRAPLSDVEVNSLLFTNLLPSAAYFLINAEMDDAGIVEPATCGCKFREAGMNLQIRDIFSYGKLTGQGITLLGSDVVHVLEEALPARFGGSPCDYQLVEREGARQTQVILRVSPRVGATDTAEIRGYFLAEIRKFYGGSLAARQWQHSEGIEVAIEEPAATSTGKILPLHMLARGSEQNGKHAA